MSLPGLGSTLPMLPRSELPRSSVPAACISCPRYLLPGIMSSSTNQTKSVGAVSAIYSRKTQRRVEGSKT